MINPLLEDGYPSIGCEPCTPAPPPTTRAAAAGPAWPRPNAGSTYEHRHCRPTPAPAATGAAADRRRHALVHRPARRPASPPSPTRWPTGCAPRGAGSRCWTATRSARTCRPVSASAGPTATSTSPGSAGWPGCWPGTGDRAGAGDRAVRRRPRAGPGRPRRGRRPVRARCTCRPRWRSPRAGTSRACTPRPARGEISAMTGVDDPYESPGDRRAAASTPPPSTLDDRPSQRCYDLLRPGRDCDRPAEGATRPHLEPDDAEAPAADRARRRWSRSRSTSSGRWPASSTRR